MEKLKNGQRVTHTRRPDWGLGQMWEDEHANEIRLFSPTKASYSCSQPPGASSNW